LRIFKYIFIALASFLSVPILLVLLLNYLSYDLKDAIKNYELNSKNIEQLIIYYSSIVPPDHIVKIEFKSKTNINLEVYVPNIDDASKRKLLFREWNIDIYNYTPADYRSDYDLKYGGLTNSLDEVKEVLGWDNNVFQTLYKSLEAANCISIVRTRNYYSVGFQRSLMSKYYYQIYDHPLSYELQQDNTNDCNLLFYKDNVVLEYGSGAVGSFCSGEFKRN